MTRIGNGGEQDLVRGIQRGDRVAMKLLYCRYAGCLTAVCSRYVACMDDVRRPSGLFREDIHFHSRFRVEG